MATKRYDISLTPNESLESKAIALSEKLEPRGTYFTLKKDSYYAHISLYMTLLRDEDLEKIQAILADIASQNPKFDLIATRYFQPEGYIDVEYEKSDELGNVQMQVVEAINPYRDGLRELDISRIEAGTGKFKEYLQKYGYRGIGEFFRPHMTFTRFTMEQAIDTKDFPSVSDFDGDFVKLGVFEMSDHGTCKQKIAEFNLGGNKK